MNHLYALKAKEIWAYMKTQDVTFWLINIYLFLEYVRPQTLYPVIDVLPYSQIIIVLTLCLFLLRGAFDLVGNPLNKLVLLYSLVVILSSLFAISPDESFKSISIFMSWVLIYFLIINIVNTEERFLIFILGFFLYSFKMSQFSFLNWVASGFSFIQIGSGGGPGLFKNSGEFGIQMVIFLSLSASCFVALKGYWSPVKKVFFFLFPLTALTGTISSSSRGALLGVGGVLLSLLLKSRHKFKGLVSVGMVVLLVFAFLPDRQMARFQAAGTDDDSIRRLVLWEQGFDLTDRYPVLGVGYHNWLVALEKFYPDANQQVCHNVFIECASELGYTGLMVFLLMIVFTFVNNAQTRRLAYQSSIKNRFLYYMAHGLDSALVGYLVSGFFVTVLYYPFFWINLAMTVSLREVAKKWSVSLANNIITNDCSTATSAMLHMNQTS
ncbi:MAG: hypothetical protein FP815_13350 [Desulfobulbaceae bacterium]|nr:hypothetical protein [Desulfobulbaceae bacterium]